MSSSSDFFVVGGNLDAQNKSYVSRPADEELYNQIVSGHFCYILTPRQMGKSSLMVRTASRLEAAGYRTVQIDLNGIGKDIAADAWYQGLLYRLSVDLALEVDFPVWWTEHSGKPMPRRFIEFLRTVVLAQVNEPVTIFIDEIDTTLDLDFSDDFFAAIRFIYNERARDAVYNRLTFALLGVATPNDLMKDTNRTPFNIGRRIELHEFSRDKAHVLADGLDNYWAGQGDTILNHIFYWTNGHPYLTQKLCEAATNAEVAQWTAVQVDELVKNNFLSDQNIDDSNLESIERNIKVKPIPERRRLLSLYQKVYTGRTIRSNPRSSAQNYLILIGLVREENTCLRVRNEIYRQVFGPDWIKEYMPADVQRRVAILTSLLALFLVSLLIFFVWTRQDPPDIQAQVCRDSFSQAASPAVRMDALACLFDLGPGYDEEARQLFYSLSPTDQKYLFLLDEPQAVGLQLLSAVRGIYVTLDWMEGDHDRAIMEAMLKALEDSGQSEASNLITEIEHWKNGREAADSGQYEQAVISYTLAIEANTTDTHPVVYYDRALAYIELSQYGNALADLERIVVIAQSAPPTPTPTSTLASPTPTNTPTSTPTPSVTPTRSPIPSDTPQPGPQIMTLPTDSQTIPNLADSPTPTPTSLGLITGSTPTAIQDFRFINADRILDTVKELVSQVQELQGHLANNPGSYPQLVVLLAMGDEFVEINSLDPWASLGLRSGQTFLDFEGSYDCFLQKNSDQSTDGSIQPVARNSGTALQLNYDLGSVDSNWSLIRCNFNPPLDLSAFDHLRFDWRGDPAAANSIRVALINPSSSQDFNIFAQSYDHSSHHAWWGQLVIPFSLLQPWNPGSSFDPSLVSGFFLSVAKVSTQDTGGTGSLAIDNLNAYNVASRTVPAQFELVSGNMTAATAAANWIAGRQTNSGLLQSWEEPNCYAWLYDQSLGLIVLANAGRWTEADRLLDALALLQESDGAWTQGYGCDNLTSPINYRWEGSIAWLVYALNRYLAEGGSHSQAVTMRDNAVNWLVGRIDPADGCLTTIDRTEGTIGTWWALQASGRITEASGLKQCLLTHYWDESMGCFKGGKNSQQPYSLVDQTWGAAFLGAIGEDDKARRALSYAWETLRLPAQEGQLYGLDGNAGPWSVWNEGTAQYVATGGAGANDLLQELLAQQRADGALPGSPDEFVGGHVWATRTAGVAPTAWLYFALLGEPFHPLATATAPSPTFTPTNTPSLSPSPTPTQTPVPPPGQIVFVSDRSGVDQLYSIPAGGGDPVQLTFTNAIEPSYAPGTNQIVFTSVRETQTDEWAWLYLMDVFEREETNVGGQNWDNADPAFSPDGRRIAFISSRNDTTNPDPEWGQVFSINSDGSDLTQLTNLPPPAKDWGPAWSPDGRRIAFVSDRSGQADIWLMDADGRNPAPLTTDEASDTEPAWSPDGQEIIFASNRSGSYDIYVMDINGQNVRNITNSTGVDENFPAWSPDGNWLTFTRFIESTDIFVMSIDGNEVIRLTFDSANDRQSIWLP